MAASRLDRLGVRWVGITLNRGRTRSILVGGLSNRRRRSWGSLGLGNRQILSANFVLVDVDLGERVIRNLQDDNEDNEQLGDFKNLRSQDSELQNVRRERCDSVTDVLDDGRKALNADVSDPLTEDVEEDYDPGTVVETEIGSAEGSVTEDIGFIESRRQNGQIKCRDGDSGDAEVAELHRERLFDAFEHLLTVNTGNDGQSNLSEGTQERYHGPATFSAAIELENHDGQGQARKHDPLELVLACAEHEESHDGGQNKTELSKNNVHGGVET